MAAFQHVLEIAVQNHVAQEDMPKSLRKICRDHGCLSENADNYIVTQKG